MSADKKVKEAYAAILASDFERAIRLFEEAIAEEPEESAHYYKLSITYSRSGKLDKALDAAKTALKYAPGNESYAEMITHIEAKRLMEKAKSALAKRDLEKKDQERVIHQVADWLEEAVRLDPLSAEAFLFLSAAYEEEGKIGPAIGMVREALRLSPQLPEAKRLLTRLLRHYH